MKAEPYPCCSSEQADRWLPVLFDLHTRRWATRATTGVFGVPQRRSFYADLSRAAIEQGWLAFHRLDWGERPIAMQYGLVYGNRFYLLQEGYDPDFADVRPGVALRAWLIRHWIEASLAEYDFLAGVSDYKFDWGASRKGSLRVVISAHPLSKLVASDIPRFELAARERVSCMLPAWLRAWRQQVRLSRRRTLLASESGKLRSGRGPGVRTRQLLSATYSSTPIGRWGKSIASQYVWAPRSGTLLHRRSQPVCQIFQYHRVNDDRDPFFAALPSATFREQMRYLVANFPLMTLEQLARGEFPQGEPYSAAVTFDDGYRDNFVCAFPTLRELQIPATVFLTTGYVDSGELPWYDRVRLAFRLTTRSKLSISGLNGGQCDLSGARERARLAEQVLSWLRAMPESESGRVLAELFRMLGVPADLNLPNQMLRWDEVRKMANSGVTFGAHTVNHRVLSRIGEAEMRREILESKRAIENRLQKPVLHFAYPFGQPFDFNAQAKAVVKDSGFKTAVTTVWGLNEPSADPYELRRFTPWGSGIEAFRLSLDWYRFCKLPALEASSGEAALSKGMS